MTTNPGGISNAELQSQMEAMFPNETPEDANALWWAQHSGGGSGDGNYLGGPDDSLSSEDAVEYILSINPWLREMGDGVYDLMVKLITDGVSPEVIAAEIRKSDEYKVRFAGMAQRLERGLAAITEAEYFAVEESYQRQLENAGVFSILFDTKEEFRKFSAEQIGFNVSPSEFSTRMDKGYAAVADARQEIEATFQSYYGVAPTPNAQLAYFLDPERGTNEIENQIAATLVGGEALAYGLNVTRTRAELLAAGGVSQQMARQGYASIAREQPVIERLAEMTVQNPLSQEDLEDFFFHSDPDIMAQRQRVFQTALGKFRATRGETQEGGFTELVDRKRTV